MPLFKINKIDATRISLEDRHHREEFVHRLIEENLGIFFEGLVFIAHKPRIGGKEFDTLALDTATKTPVLIEYKREKDRGVVEQVSLYYVKFRNNKADVVMLFSQSKTVETLSEIDFDNPQIIVIAKDYTREQRELLTLMKDYLRLWRFQLYSGDVMSLEEAEPLGSVRETSKERKAGRRDEQGPFDIDHYGMNIDTLKAFKALDSLITLDARVQPGKINKQFIGYKATGSYFACIAPRVNSLKIEFKFRRQPPSLRKVKLIRIPDNAHTPMTHRCKISSINQAKALVPAIKEALEGSL